MWSEYSCVYLLMASPPIHKFNISSLKYKDPFHFPPQQFIVLKLIKNALSLLSDSWFLMNVKCMQFYYIYLPITISYDQPDSTLSTINIINQQNATATMTIDDDDVCMECILISIYLLTHYIHRPFNLFISQPAVARMELLFVGVSCHVQSVRVSLKRVFISLYRALPQCNETSAECNKKYT